MAGASLVYPKVTSLSWLSTVLFPAVMREQLMRDNRTTEQVGCDGRSRCGSHLLVEGRTSPGTAEATPRLTR